MCNRQRGFTLLELLVALVIAGLLMVTLTQGMRAGLRAWSVEGRVSQSSGGIEATDHALRQLIARMLPGETRSRDPPLIGTPHSVSFVTTLPEGFGARSTDEADVTLQVSPAHRLELRWRPHYRRWIATAPAPASITLMENVESIDIAFFHAPLGPQQGRWVSAWSERDLPALVRVRVKFAPDDPRHWPDLVMAPMRQRAPS
jgi:general secretion pathway protein J